MENLTDDLLIEEIQILEELKSRDDYQRWKMNPEEFFEECLMVAHKEAEKGFVPFNLLPGQKLILDKMEAQMKTKGYVRLIVAKGRQLGISTLTSAYIFHRTIFYPNVKSLIVAHDATTTGSIFEMSKNFYEFLSGASKLERIASNRTELKFSNNSSYRVYTAGSEEAGRGITAHCGLYDEVAFWAKGEKVMAGLANAIGLTKGSIVVMNSTSNGPSGLYYEQWDKASKGESSFEPVFVSWFEQDLKEYSLATPEEFELTLEEDELKLNYGLRDDQINWRRMKIADSTLLAFKQEYPMTAAESFVTSGSNVFEPESLDRYIPEKEIGLRDFNRGLYTFDETREGSLALWEGPKSGEKYIIGADPAQGVGGDYSSAVVMTSDRRIVALYRNNRMDPAGFGEVLFYLGRWYNQALIAPESNSIGIAVIQQLLYLKYSNIYKPSKTANITASDSVNAYGFRTTSVSKPTIIANLQAVIKDFDVAIPSRTMLDELRNYIILGDTQKMGSAPGWHDDTVIALAIAIEAYRTDRHNLSAGGFDFSQYRESVPQRNWI